MRVWTLHPKYLNKEELQVCWDEGLKALDILSDPERVERFHPGLSVFRTQSQPVYSLSRYLEAIAREGERRGLHMDLALLPRVPEDFRLKIPVSPAWLESEKNQLAKRLARLSRWHVRKLKSIRSGRIHPLFFLETNGQPGAWELLSRIKLSR